MVAVRDRQTHLPSETASGQQWLANFPEPDRPAAVRLVDSLDFVGETRFRIELVNLVTRVLGTVERPTALYAVWEHLPSPRYGPQPALDLHKAAGSELIVLNILRDVVRKHPGVALEPSLQELKDGRYRSVVFVDDFGGSGIKTSRAVRRWLAHPTIRSWRSYGRLHAVVALHTVSRQALTELGAQLPRASIEYLWAARQLEDAGWTDEELDEVRDLCFRYAKNRRYALGYGDSGLLTIFQHTAPNNIPMILRQRPARGFHWVPFFADDQVSAEQAEALADYAPERGPGDVAAGLGEMRLAAALQPSGTHPSKEIVLLLAAVAHGHRDDHRIARDLRIPQFSVVRLVDAARGLSLLDHERRLTDKGRAELRVARSRSSFTRPVHADRDDPYYPRYR